MTSPSIDVWAIGIMYYAMLYGHLPFWADTEDDFIDKIISQPLKFDQGVHITNECKELLKGMLHKNPEKRVQLVEVMALPYFFMDDSELEDQLIEIEQNFQNNKQKEEEKLEKSQNEDLLAGLNLGQI